MDIGRLRLGTCTKSKLEKDTISTADATTITTVSSQPAWKGVDCFILPFKLRQVATS